MRHGQRLRIEALHQNAEIRRGPAVVRRRLGEDVAHGKALLQIGRRVRIKVLLHHALIAEILLRRAIGRTPFDLTRAVEEGFAGMEHGVEQVGVDADVPDLQEAQFGKTVVDLHPGMGIMRKGDKRERHRVLRVKACPRLFQLSAGPVSGQTTLRFMLWPQAPVHFQHRFLPLSLPLLEQIPRWITAGSTACASATWRVRTIRLLRPGPA
jgi:hypothetical protein